MATGPTGSAGSQGSAEERKTINTLHERLDLLETHLQQLRQDLRQIRVRVNRQAVLGNMMQQASRPGVTSQVEVPAPPLAQGPAASEAAPPTQPTFEVVAAATPAPADGIPSASEPVESEPAEPVDRFADLDALEAQAGGAWLTWLSYACFLVGAGLLVKHVWDLGWISPALWQGGGWAVGSALLVAGEWAERNGASRPARRPPSLVPRVLALLVLLATVLYLGVSIKANYLMPGSPGLGLHLTQPACLGLLLGLTAAGGAGLLARSYVRSGQPTEQALGEIFLALAGAGAVLGAAGLLSEQLSLVLWFWSLLAVALGLGLLSYRTKVLHVPLVMTVALLAAALLIAAQQGQMGDTNFLWQVQRFGPITCSALLPAGAALVILGFWNARLVVHPRTMAEPMPLLGEALAAAAALGLLLVSSLEVHRLFQDIALVHEVDPARVVWLTDSVHAEWVALSVLWALLALVYVVAGLVFSVRALRLFGLALFAITAIKVLLLDMARVELINRAACTIGLGVFSLLASYIYQRVRPAIPSGH